MPREDSKPSNEDQDPSMKQSLAPGRCWLRARSGISTAQRMRSVSLTWDNADETITAAKASDISRARDLLLQTPTRGDRMRRNCGPAY